MAPHLAAPPHHQHSIYQNQPHHQPPAPPSLVSSLQSPSAAGRQPMPPHPSLPPLPSISSQSFLSQSGYGPSGSDHGSFGPMGGSLQGSSSSRLPPAAPPSNASSSSRVESGTDLRKLWQYVTQVEPGQRRGNEHQVPAFAGGAGILANRKLGFEPCLVPA